MIWLASDSGCRIPRFLYVLARSWPTPFAELVGLLTDRHALSLPINGARHLYCCGCSNSLASAFGSMFCIGVLGSRTTFVTGAASGGVGVKAAAAIELLTVEIPTMKMKRRILYFGSGLIGLLAFSPCLHR